MLAIVLQLIAYSFIHIYQRSILKSHALCQSWILVVEMFISVQCYIRQPSNLLGASSTENNELLVSHMDCDFDGILPFHFEFMFTNQILQLKNITGFWGFGVLGLGVRG